MANLIHSIRYTLTLCCHTNRTGTGSSCLKLHKSDYPILSEPTTVRGTVELQQEAPPPVK
jgi:hypothetical protein